MAIETQTIPGPGDETSAEAETLVESRDELPEPKAVRAGAILGRYVVIGELGHGGMGTVVRAYDPKLHREVALKLVRGGNSDSARRHLVREAQVMAQLSHPNVVAVHDVETIGDDVMIVMELVLGPTLRTWLEVVRPWPEVVDALRQAGQGLAAAHRAGLVHRDFKPANALVDDHGRVKVTDFGLARPMGENDPSSTGSHDEIPTLSRQLELATIGGSYGPAGTPRYMAPEQHVGDPATTASDQYALCVSLWAALTRKPPFTGATMAADKRKGPPPWVADVAVPREIVDALRRGLSPDPHDRFQKLDDLLAAFTPRASRWRWFALAGAIVALTTAAVFGGLALGKRDHSPPVCSASPTALDGVWNESRRAIIDASLRGSGPAFAATTAEHTVAKLDTYAMTWTGAHREACEATNVRGERSGHVLDLRMQCLDRARVALRSLLDVLADADRTVAERAVQAVAGLTAPNDCLDDARIQSGVEPPSDPDVVRAVEQIRADLSTTDALRRAGKITEALARIDGEVQRARATHYDPILAEALRIRGAVSNDSGDNSAAADALIASYMLSLAAGDDFYAARVAAGLIITLGYADRSEESKAWALHADALLRRVGLAGPFKADIHDGLGYAYRKERRFDESIAEHEQALAALAAVDDASELRKSMTLDLLAAALLLRGELAAARERHEEVVAIRERELGPKHPYVGAALTNLGASLFEAGDVAGTRETAERALAIYEEALPAGHASLHEQYSNLGLALMLAGELDRAQQLLEKALAQVEGTEGPDSPNLMNILSTLGGLHQEREQLEEALALQRRAEAIAVATAGPSHYAVAAAGVNVAHSLAALGRGEEALAHAQRCLAMVDGGRGPARLVGDIWQVVSVGQRLTGHPAEAVDAARTGLSILEGALDPQHRDLRSALVVLGEALTAAGEPGQAVGPLSRAMTLPSEGEAEVRLGRARLAYARAVVASGGSLPSARAAIERALAAADAASHRAGHRRELRQWLDDNP